MITQKVYNAYKDNKKIQYQFNDSELWHDFEGALIDTYVTILLEYKWRIKPVPRIQTRIIHLTRHVESIEVTSNLLMALDQNWNRELTRLCPLKYRMTLEEVIE